MKSKINKYAQVVFPVPVSHSFTYSIPCHFSNDIAAGIRVLAPFGPRKMTGFVVDIVSTPGIAENKIKALEQVLDPVPLFTPQVLKLTKWISEYYLCSWGQVLKAVLPAGIHLNSERVVRLIHKNPHELIATVNNAPRQLKILQILMQENPVSIKKLLRQSSRTSLYTSLQSMAGKNWIRQELALPRVRVGKKIDCFVRIPANISSSQVTEWIAKNRSNAPKQAHCMEILHKEAKEINRTELVRQAQTTTSTIQQLEEKKLVTIFKKTVFRDYYFDLEAEPPPQITLNPAQKNALNAIHERLDSNRFSTQLLHGVTGSGKTQVYIESIYRVLAQGKTAIVLVPEIALTPQMVRRFRSHFGDRVAVFHSRMSPGERYDAWRRTWGGNHQIVIGPRSAIFAPLKNIGLIVVDEEHDSSYKQSDIEPRYHAREVAIIRARLSNAIVVLGSATPSVESRYNADIGKFHLLQLPKRVEELSMPKVRIVDMRREPRTLGRHDPTIFSRTLRQLMEEKLSRGEQVILLQNRRGFATILKCKKCGYDARCENCDITLTYHIPINLLKCHHCGYARKAPVTCPQCQSEDIIMKGIGTQRVEEELKLLFPGIKSTRMDMDTTKGKHAHDKILKKFAQKEYQILLGTQMVAKGLDFPNVTLVGVISADTELLLPDFRAGEHAFQLLTQVAGRAGRKHKQGLVVIQTYSPEHPSLIYAKSHDYISFYKNEMLERKQLLYPPFSRFIRLLFRGPSEEEIQTQAQLLAAQLKGRKEFRLLGPTPAPLSKIQGNFRWQILLSTAKSIDTNAVKTKYILMQTLDHIRKNKKSKIDVQIDVDPVSTL
ncbi:primosomal protein N' [candidate division KSB1 bacterium]|nr:primosomal protein N' [candidate division KSB1 bacterium]